MAAAACGDQRANTSRASKAVLVAAGPPRWLHKSNRNTRKQTINHERCDASRVRVQTGHEKHHGSKPQNSQTNDMEHRADRHVPQVRPCCIPADPKSTCRHLSQIAQATQVVRLGIRKGHSDARARRACHLTLAHPGQRSPRQAALRQRLQPQLRRNASATPPTSKPRNVSSSSSSIRLSVNCSRLYQGKPSVATSPTEPLVTPTQGEKRCAGKRTPATTREHPRASSASASQALEERHALNLRSADRRKSAVHPSTLGERPPGMENPCTSFQVRRKRSFPSHPMRLRHNHRPQVPEVQRNLHQSSRVGAGDGIRLCTIKVSGPNRGTRCVVRRQSKVSHQLHHSEKAEQTRQRRQELHEEDREVGSVGHGNALRRQADVIDHVSHSPPLWQTPTLKLGNLAGSKR